MKVAIKDAVVRVEFRKDASLEFDWHFEVFLNDKLISHGLAELDAFGEVLDMMLTGYVKDHQPRLRSEVAVPVHPAALPDSER